MSTELLTPSNQATITVTFYFGPGDKPPYRLSKNYVIQKWQDEADLRRILPEIAAELNHISGYGILSIVVASEQFNFTVDYKDQFKPYKPGDALHFSALLRFEVGRYTDWKSSPVRLEVPRIHWTTGYTNPVKKYDPNDNLFQIKAVTVGRAKQIKKYGTIFHLSYDRDNPILNSFLKHISEGGIFAPEEPKPWRHHQNNYIKISWWELPRAQWSITKWKKIREQEEKKQKAEERKRKQLEKAGIVYKDKKATKKADQVYVIQMMEDGNPSGIYKIGISNAPGKRLRSLSTSIPYETQIVHQFVAEPAEEAEAQLHAKFKVSRMKGEWFRLTSEQVAELKQITQFKNGKFIQNEEPQNYLEKP